MGKKNKIIFSDNTLWGLVNFRGDVIRYFLNRGFEIVLVAPQERDSVMKTEVPSEVRYVPVHINRCSKNVFHDFSYLKALYHIYKKERPDVVFHYTIKPNIYGSLICSFLHIPSVCTITGLGHALVGSSFKNKLAASFYSLGMRSADRVFVLNQFIADFIREKKLCGQRKIILLQGGEGVCLDKFPYKRIFSEQTTFLMIGRLLQDKGYREFVGAAREVLSVYKNVRFQVLGPLDYSYPNHITREEVERDVQDGIIEYLGVTDDVLPYLHQPGVVVVLPSYHEGLNRSLMEACSCGCPIITSDIPGCREMVDPGKNGFLIPVRNIKLLREAMIQYHELSAAEKDSFSKRSRNIAESKLDMRFVIEKYADVLTQIRKS